MSWRVCSVIRAGDTLSSRASPAREVGPLPPMKASTADRVTSARELEEDEVKGNTFVQEQTNSRFIDVGLSIEEREDEHRQGRSRGASSTFLLTARPPCVKVDLIQT